MEVEPPPQTEPELQEQQENVSTQPYDYLVDFGIAGDGATGKSAWVRATQTISLFEKLNIPKQQWWKESHKPILHFMEEYGVSAQEFYSHYEFQSSASGQITPKTRDFDEKLLERGLENMSPEVAAPYKALYDQYKTMNTNLKNLIGQIKERTKKEGKLPKDDPDIVRFKELSADIDRLDTEINKDGKVKEMGLECTTFEDFILNVHWTVVAQVEYFNLNVNGKNVQVRLRDLGGQDRFRWERVNLYKGLNAYIAMFDLARPDTLNNIMKFKRPTPPQYNKLNPASFGWLILALPTDAYDEFIRPNLDGELKNMNPKDFVVELATKVPYNRFGTIKSGLISENNYNLLVEQYFPDNLPEYNALTPKTLKSVIKALSADQFHTLIQNPLPPESGYKQLDKKGFDALCGTVDPEQFETVKQAIISPDNYRLAKDIVEMGTPGWFQEFILSLTQVFGQHMVPFGAFGNKEDMVYEKNGKRLVRSSSAPTVTFTRCVEYMEKNTIPIYFEGSAKELTNFTEMVKLLIAQTLVARGLEQPEFYSTVYQQVVPTINQNYFINRDLQPLTQ